MATKKPAAKSKPVTATPSPAVPTVSAKPLTPFFTTDPRLPAARQNAELVSAAGIVNGMDQDAIDARLLAVLGDAHA